MILEVYQSRLLPQTVFIFNIVSGMKVDMGGSAAVLGAFQAHVLQSSKSRPINVHALLCLADNAVDALSTRPDDILHMYSGKTVEVNNTDAEGRLVLADGVAYASKHLNPDVILDIATLTGAVMVGLGKRHAGIVCNDKDLEESMIKMGKKSGNLLFPMLYAPEVLVQTAKQFDSSVADMTNSVSDRMNASSSCAAHFIESNLVGEKWDWEKNGSSTNKGLWVHLDIAGTADISGTATGFGVALLAEFAASF